MFIYFERIKSFDNNIFFGLMVSSSYIPVLIFLLVATLLASVIFFISFILVPRHGNREKLSAYECGFDPFGDTRGRFDVRFYLVAILFIIFDLEITFFFPWILVLNRIDFLGFSSMMLFLFILSVGFAYEWSKGALEWE